MQGFGVEILAELPEMYHRHAQGAIRVVVGNAPCTLFYHRGLQRNLHPGCTPDYREEVQHPHVLGRNGMNIYSSCKKTRRTQDGSHTFNSCSQKSTNTKRVVQSRKRLGLLLARIRGDPPIKLCKKASQHSVLRAEAYISTLEPFVSTSSPSF